VNFQARKYDSRDRRKNKSSFSSHKKSITEDFENIKGLSLLAVFWFGKNGLHFQVKIAEILSKFRRQVKHFTQKIVWQKTEVVTSFTW